MAKKKFKQPTERELEILRILWQNGESTVRQVNQHMNKTEKVGYTTPLKLMQIMTEKGLIQRDDSSFKHLYKSCISENQVQSRLVGDLLDKAFAGSAAKLVMKALSARKIDPKELEQIKKIISEREEN